MHSHKMKKKKENEMWFVFSCLCAYKDIYTDTDIPSYCQKSRLSGWCSSFSPRRFVHIERRKVKEMHMRCRVSEIKTHNGTCGVVVRVEIDWITFWLRVTCTLKCFSRFLCVCVARRVRMSLCFHVCVLVSFLMIEWMTCARNIRRKHWAKVPTIKWDTGKKIIHLHSV